MENDTGWGDAKSDAMEYALNQFDNRLETSREDFKDVDFKARYWLTGLLGLVTALTAWFIRDSSQALNLPLLILLLGYAVAAIFFAISLWPRPTSGKGVTPDKFEEWRGDLEAESGLNALIARVIAVRYDQISTNEETVGKKAFWIKWGIAVAVSAPAISLLLFLACR